MFELLLVVLMSNNTLNIDRILPMNIDPMNKSCIRMRQEKSGVVLGGKFNVRFIRILWKKSLDILLILDVGVKAFNLFSYIIIMWVGTLQRGKFQWKFISFTFKKFCDGVKTTKVKISWKFHLLI